MSRYQLFESRYVDGKDWSELPYENTSGRRRDKLHQAIKNEGYKSQWELQKSKKNDNTLTEYYINAGITVDRDVEVGIGIDRDGSIVFVRDGKNRLCISKLLDLEEIPVQVRIRHEEWQAIRDDIRNSNLPIEQSNHQNHPDLQDLVDKSPSEPIRTVF